MSTAVEVAAGHYRLARKVASWYALHFNHHSRNMDDLSQEAYIGMISAVEDLLSGKIAAKDFPRVAGSRAKARVNVAANRYDLPWTTPWLERRRIWARRREGNPMPPVITVDAHAEDCPLFDECDKTAGLADCVDDALAELGGLDESLLRQFFGVGNLTPMTVGELAKLYGMRPHVIAGRIEDAKGRLRPILSRMMEDDL